MRNLKHFARSRIRPSVLRPVPVATAMALVASSVIAAGVPEGPPSPACGASYILDDGTADMAFYGGLDVDSLWLNRFVVLPGSESITAVDVCWVGWPGADGALPLGHPVAIVVLDDPDGDGKPADATPIAVVRTVVKVDAPGAYQRIPVGEVPAGTAGASFFAGVFTTTPAEPRKPGPPPFPPAVYYPSAADDSGDGTQSWIAAWPGGEGAFDAVNDLQSLADWGYAGVFLVRAIPAPPAIGDLDCNGLVDGADLGTLLGAWGHCPADAACAADLDGDGAVDGADLGLVLGAWGT